jgi:hypothetical protein
VTGRLALATRVMKARRAGWCSVCRRPVAIGQPIARLIKPAGWCHVGCVPIVARTLGSRSGDGGIRRW